MFMNWRIKKNILILAAIILIGVFLRTYHFQDYLRFNPDQARDANIIREIADKERPLPLLGPKAGGTEFRLGPAFYWLQYGSAKIFGSDPEKLAYPDLLFGLLSIPLLYIFLRKYFSRKTALVSVALLAVSFYAVKYSRFAWNPNSAPFFSLMFLYALTEIVRLGQKRRLLWAAILGIAVGIGVQLHSVMLFSFPIILLIYFIYLGVKKNPAWKRAWLVILVAVFLNIPQLVNEFTSLEKNSRAFILALDAKSSRSATFVQKVERTIICHIQANGFIISSAGSGNDCDLMEISSQLKKNKKDPAKNWKNALIIANAVLSVAFSLGGYVLLIYFWRKEKDPDKKSFLGIISLYAAVLFVVLAPMALEISMRFFLPLMFIPFVLFGLWAKFLSGRFGKKGLTAMFILAAALALLNVFSLKEKFDYLAGRAPEKGDFEEITLGEVEYMSRFMIERSGGAKKSFLKGKRTDLFEITKPIRYFSDEAGLEIIELRKGDEIKKDEKLFSVDVDKKTGQEDAGDGYDIADRGVYGRIRIFELKAR